MVALALVACVFASEEKKAKVEEEPKQAPGPDPVAVYKGLGQKQIHVNKAAAHYGKKHRIYYKIKRSLYYSSDF